MTSNSRERESHEDEVYQKSQLEQAQLTCIYHISYPQWKITLAQERKVWVKVKEIETVEALY